MSYQDRDREVVDYELFRLFSGGPELRGPRPERLEPGGYFVCVGAAQTYGCFCERPWPALLSERLGIPVLNLGIAGAGPGFFLDDRWRPWLANARFAVVQVMSGRSEDNSLFESGGLERLRRRDDGRRLGAAEAWSELFETDLRRWRGRVARGVANRLLATFGRRRLRALVEETRANWVGNTARLLDSIQSPTALLWFSKREPHYRGDYRNVWRLFGEYPQLVGDSMVRSARERADAYVKCVTSRGSPQPLFSRFTGEPVVVRPAGQAPWTHNAYYPSPEMHEDAADALEATCRGWLD